ncbi:unnamed protein product, partial [Porites evermanni]
EHIEIIRQKYKRHEGWLVPFPWCEEFQFQLSDIYIRLRMVSREKKARATAQQRVVETTEIFKPHEECKQPRKVLIEGKPGMGKTTYCNKSDLWGAIDDQLLPGEILQNEREKFFEFIRQNQSKVLLILDGLDELPLSKLPEFTEIIQGKMLPLCYLVVTARHEAGIPVRKICDTLLEIKGFSYEDSKEFIHKYFAGKKDLAEKLLDKIKNEERLKEMTGNPLNTALLCLLCEEFQGILPESRTQLYLEIAHSLNGLYDDNMYFEDKRLSSENADVPEFGFLSAQPGSSKRRPCLCYGFTHKSFQEFFAGYHLCYQLVSKDISPYILVTDTRYFRELREVLKFTCGLLAVRSEESAVSLILCIANEVNEEKGENVYLLRWKLDLADNDLYKLESIGDADAAVLAVALETNTTLTNLNLAHNNLGFAGAESLAAALKTNTTLTNLDLSWNNLGPAGAELLATALKTNTTLTNLNLSRSKLGPAGAESLAKALKTNTTLTNLDLSGNNLGPASAESLATALNISSTLRNVNLSDNNVGPTVAESLATALKTNTSLTNLNLSVNNLGSAGAESLSTALKTNTTLRNLDLSGNNLGPAGAESLATALKTNTTLTNLNVSWNNLGPAGAESLVTGLETNTTLTNLNLSRNKLGPADAESLAKALKPNTTLTKLDL